MSDQNIALSLRSVTKDFILPHEKQNSLKERVLSFKKPSYEKLHVLKGINIEIKKGEFFGIVGRNGSGKSTLLKIIGGIYQPTSGEVRVNGTLTPFIELGIGFNPDLTGRENVFLNGAILGLGRKEIKQKYAEIVAFAELEKFMDQKLKNYSSGMQVRLAFAIAIQAHNDILLIDEVLAVGDSNFQKKCFDTFKKIKKSGKTVIFVTHDMGAVQAYCDRAMMIQDSEILIIGTPQEVALRYEVANISSEDGNLRGAMQRPSNPFIKLTSLQLVNPKPKNEYVLTDEIKIRVDFEVKKSQEVQFNLYFVRPQDGQYIAGLNTTQSLKKFTPSVGHHTIVCGLPARQFARGNYRLNIGVYTCSNPAELIDVIDSSYGEKTPVINLLENSSSQDGLFNAQGEWFLESDKKSQ